MRSGHAGVHKKFGAVGAPNYVSLQDAGPLHSQVDGVEVSDEVHLNTSAAPGLENLLQLRCYAYLPLLHWLARASSVIYCCGRLPRAEIDQEGFIEAPSVSREISSYIVPSTCPPGIVHRRQCALSILVARSWLDNKPLASSVLEHGPDRTGRFDKRCC